jgi:hypothetical protein
VEVAQAEPALKTGDKLHHMDDPVAQQRGGRHGHISAHQQVLDHLVGAVDTPARGERGINAPRQQAMDSNGRRIS